MTETTMLVRLQSGEIVRRHIALRQYFSGLGREVIELPPEPQLHDDERAVWTLGDPIPMIVKTL